MRELWQLWKGWLRSVQRCRLPVVGEKPERSDVKGNADNPEDPAGPGCKNPVVHEVGEDGNEPKMKIGLDRQV